MSFWSRFLIKNAVAVTIASFILAAVGTYYSVHLFMNLRTEIEELLPTDARSVVDLDEVKSRLESINNICILIFSEHPDKSKQFVTDLAKELQTIPKDIAQSVEYRIDQELKFFNERKSLFIEDDDLKKVKNYIKDKINYEIQLYNPLTIIQNKTIQEPKLDLMGLKKKYTGKTDSYTHFKDGFYASKDQKIRVILVNIPGNAGGMSGATKLRAAIDQAILKVDPKKYSPDITIQFTGGAQGMLEEHHALVEDLLLSTIIVTVLVGLAMILYFRSIAATFALISALFAGTFLTFGLSYFLVGYLNANSAFMGSIVIGNGINFGIIMLARFMEERRNGVDTLQAIALGVDKTFSATVVAAAAAGLSYGSLMLTSFRGFRQFGVIGFVGMAFCWFAAYSTLPALLATLHQFGCFRKPAPPHIPRVANFVKKIVEKSPRAILIFSALITIISIISFSRLDSSIIETDMRKLRNKKSLESGAMYWDKYQDEVFQRYLTPIAILPHTREEVRAIAEEVKKEKERLGEKSFIVNVSTIEDFVPKNQSEKVQTLLEIKGLLSKRILYYLTPEQKTMTQELLSEGSRQPFAEKDLPELVRSKFRERTGAVGNLVLVEPTLSEELNKSDNLISFVKSIREAADRVLPGVAIAGTLMVTADMFESIVRDGPKATLFAFIAVLLLVVILFRSIPTILQCSAALILGVIWLFGFILIFHQKINFLNFIALPITFGIGVDYGVNIFQRYRLEKSEGILPVITHTGGAVMLASLTTIIGYGSLIIASNQAFVSFGLLAIVGELTCVFTAVVSLPAFIWYIEKNAKQQKNTSV